MKNKNLFVTTNKEIVYQNKWSSVTKTNIENENLKKNNGHLMKTTEHYMETKTKIMKRMNI